MSTFFITIPTYNDGPRLKAFVRELAQSAPCAGPAGELVVVDDGSRPENAQLHADGVEAATRTLKQRGSTFSMRLVVAPRNQGKGAAIRLGWSEAPADATWLGFLDGDGAVPAREFWRLVGLAEGQGDTFDVLAGSRIRMAGHHVDRSLGRHLQGRVFATLVELTLRLGFYDTQCGVKLVRGDLLRPRLDFLEENRWLIDIELLSVLQHDGARCREEPIDWTHDKNSNVVPGVDAGRMFLGLQRLKARLARLR